MSFDMASQTSEMVSQTSEIAGQTSEMVSQTELDLGILQVLVISYDMANPIEHSGYYCVYILKLANNQLYTGFTRNISKRLSQHKEGNVKSTSYRRPIKLIHLELYTSRDDALRREKFLKSTEGKILLRRQIKHKLSLEGII